MTNKLEAIFYPLVSKKIAGFMLLCTATLIGLGILFLPPDGRIPYALIIPDAVAMAQKSDFPFALSVTYSFGVYASLVCGFITAFTKGDLKGLNEVRQKQSRSFRVLSDIFMFLFIWFLLTQELSVNSSQFSYKFFSMIIHNRFAALMWIEGIFGFIYVSVLVCLFDISILLKRFVCK